MANKTQIRLFLMPLLKSPRMPSIEALAVKRLDVRIIAEDTGRDSAWHTIIKTLVRVPTLQIDLVKNKNIPEMIGIHPDITNGCCIPQEEFSKLKHKNILVFNDCALIPDFSTRDNGEVTFDYYLKDDPEYAYYKNYVDQVFKDAFNKHTAWDIEEKKFSQEELLYRKRLVEGTLDFSDIDETI